MRVQVDKMQRQRLEGTPGHLSKSPGRKAGVGKTRSQVLNPFRKEVDHTSKVLYWGEIKLSSR